MEHTVATIHLPKGQNVAWGFQMRESSLHLQSWGRRLGAGVAGAWVEVQVQALVEGGQDGGQAGDVAECPLTVLSRESAPSLTVVAQARATGALWLY